MVETPDNVSPSDDSQINIESNHNLPASENVRDKLFSEGYDSDGTIVECKDA